MTCAQFTRNGRVSRSRASGWDRWLRRTRRSRRLEPRFNRRRMLRIEARHGRLVTGVWVARRAGTGTRRAVELRGRSAARTRGVAAARGGRDSAAFSRCTPRRPAPPSIREVAPPSIREVAHRASVLCAGSHTRARPGESLGSLRGELERTGLAAPGQERNLPRGRASIEKRGRKRALFLRSQPMGKRCS